jgi:hypothetical protein
MPSDNRLIPEQKYRRFGEILLPGRHARLKNRVAANEKKVKEKKLAP